MLFVRLEVVSYLAEYINLQLNTNDEDLKLGKIFKQKCSGAVTFNFFVIIKVNPRYEKA